MEFPAKDIEYPTEDLPEQLLQDMAACSTSGNLNTTIQDTAKNLATIAIEPQRNFKFRYENDIKASTHGMLHGENGEHGAPTLQLRWKKLEDELYMTCSLYEEKEDKLSYHLLMEKEDKTPRFAPIVRKMTWKDDCYVGVLAGVFICAPKLDSAIDYLDKKKAELNTLFAPKQSNCNEQKDPNTEKVQLDKNKRMTRVSKASPEAATKEVPKGKGKRKRKASQASPEAATKEVPKNKGKMKSHQHAVRLCFNVYTRNKNGSYAHFKVPPIHSRPIYNKDDLVIALHMTPTVFASDQDMYLYVKGLPKKCFNDENLKDQIKATVYTIEKQDAANKWSKEIENITMPALNIIKFKCPYYYEERQNNKRNINGYPCIQCYVKLKLPEYKDEECQPMDFECLKFYNYTLNKIPSTQMDSTPAKRPSITSITSGMDTDGVTSERDGSCVSVNAQQQQPIQMDYMKILIQLLYQWPNSYVIIQNLNKQFCAQNIKRNTLFHELIERDDRVTFSLMYTKRTDKMLQELIAEAVNGNRENLYHYACNLRRSSYIMPLTTMGCKIALMDFRGRTALHTAILKQQNDCIAEFQRIFQNHKDFENTIVEDLKELTTTTYNGGGYTVLHLAVLHNLINLTKDMLQFCKDNNINACRIKVLSDGNTIAHLALSKGLDDIFSLIESYVADVDQYKNYDGVLVEEMRANVLPNKLEKLYIGNTSGSE